MLTTDGSGVNDLRRLNPIPATLSALFRLVPPFVGSRVRTQAMRAAGFSIGEGSTFFGWPTLGGSGDVRSRLRIGQHAGFNVRVHFELEDDIHIGDHVAVGHEVTFLTRTTADGGGDVATRTPVVGPIEIGDGAWLGARCMVMPGVRIGAGAIIGAAVVVSEDVPDHTLLMGTQKISLARWR